MLKENQYIKVKWKGNNKDYYESLGYTFTKFNEEFLVKAEDLPNGSHQKVEVICDFCEDVIEKEYREYLRNHKGGDCCKKCQGKKALKTFNENLPEGKNRKDILKQGIIDKYGVDNVAKVKDFHDKAMKTHEERYGALTSLGIKEINEKAIKNSWSEDSIQKRKNTNVEKYGQEWGLASEEIREKIANSYYKNGTIKTSKPQMELYNLLKSKYEKCELNYPCGRCLLDCFVEVNGIKIDIEYDGWYFHEKTQQKDMRRDYFVKSKGYKILRIISNNGIPQEKEIEEKINILLNTDKHFEKINMV